MSRRIVIRLTETEADEVWAACDSHAQDLSNNVGMPGGNGAQRAALNRAMSKIQRATVEARR